MKKLLPLLLFAFSLSANAQNYKLFPNPSDTLAFSDTEGNVIFIAFDSISSGNTYWPQKETHPDFTGSLNKNCFGHLFDTAWCGYQIVNLAPMKYTFHHTFYEFEIDLSARNTSPDSIGWLRAYGMSYTLLSKFIGKSQQTLFNNQIDSLLTFEITALDSNGITHFTNHYFEVSKNHGLISIPLLYNSDQYYAPTYNSSNAFTRSLFKPLTNGDIYDFQAGDIFHYYHGSYTIDQPWNRHRTYSNLTIIDKNQINADSVLYTVNRVYNKFVLNTQTPPFQMEEIIYRDTVKFGYGQLNERITNELTFQSDTAGSHLPYYGYSTSYSLSEKFKSTFDTNLKRSGVFTSSNQFPTNGSCILIPFEPSPKEALYLSGLGRVHYYDVNFPQVNEQSLIYFESSTGQTWGKPYNISIEELAQQRPLKIYPNPASDVLNIELPDGVQQMEITIIDQVGRTLLKESITKEKSGISVEALSPGAYFIRTNKGSAVPFIKR
ncbi:hypothetical protein Oweho_0782 [Owenweeksia hongkongensis DSM 17368]|uniref:Secretion system C-terminal sorting domain-containing protein n=1 Tax=Owenweeksia hongkongensis (strain DSM 17368 / CIP 108786 / JCM 12287 / NRRL B-23963 / UST20020801) TaxID=926562 RepID=G8R245_OWEHD|nr:T9SS type A sorting domain-containing protein [Owenweeksia hongkongensis]AEV31795.1 hypothetical protein Oweho_0782 [Owenweeksia hongkongensis DSM 17368]